MNVLAAWSKKRYADLKYQSADGQWAYGTLPSSSAFFAQLSALLTQSFL
jgi:hypothetical protein